METAEISKSRVQNLFFKRNGMPKKEALYTAVDIAENLSLDLDSMEPHERHYCLNLINSNIFQAYRNECIDSHVLWVDCKIPDQKYVYHGFTHNEKLVQNSIQRMKRRSKQQAIAYNQALSIALENGYNLPEHEIKELASKRQQNKARLIAGNYLDLKVK